MIEYERTLWQLLGLALRARDFEKARELLQQIKHKNADRWRATRGA